MLEEPEEVKTSGMLDEFEDFCRFNIRSDRESSVEVTVRQVRTLVRWFELPLSTPSPDDIRSVLTKRLTHRLTRGKSPKLKKGKISNDTFNQ